MKNRFYTVSSLSYSRDILEVADQISILSLIKLISLKQNCGFHSLYLTTCKSLSITILGATPHFSLGYYVKDKKNQVPCERNITSDTVKGLIFQQKLLILELLKVKPLRLFVSDSSLWKNFFFCISRSLSLRSYNDHI